MSHCAGLLSFPVENKRTLKLIDNGIPAFLSFLYKTLGLEITISVNQFNNDKENILLLNLFHPSNRHLPKKPGNLGGFNFSGSVKRVELDVVDCGKTAFVAEISELQSEFVFLSRNYYSLKFYKGRDTFRLFPMGGAKTVLFQGAILL